MQEKPTDQELISGCLQKDPKAQKNLFERYRSEVYKVSFRYSLNRPEAEDILQDTFIRVFERIGQFKGTGSLKNWILKITMNTALEKFRKKKHLIFKNDLEKVDAGFDDHSFNNEYHFTMKQLSEIIKQMPKGYRIVFTLYAYDHFSHKKIAEMLDISENTSKSQLSRARKYLKNELERLQKKEMINFNSTIKSGVIGGFALVLNEIG